MQKPALIHGDLTYKLIGLAMEVHRRLGPGFLEKVYDQAYIIELDLAGINYAYQKLFRIQYRDQFLRKLFTPDFVIEDKVLVDNKAIQAITDLERAKMINYLKVTKLEVGLIINYGNLSLEWERILASDKLKLGKDI
ncbi:MAG: GxxExxY protein [candidate division KSB1 bacterium]|nr:GxxExxY protein [candidate division KSB1 bacterium]MDZ7313695.1 GxxExxY protein [candidate division KSB1 bacterium]